MAIWSEKRRVMQAYDTTAEMYEERYSEEQNRKYRKALEKVQVEGSVVLDVGCGSGLFLNQISEKAKLAVGIDLSLMLLRKAKQYAGGDFFVVQADADHLPIQKGIFDAVFSFTVLQNMPNPVETVAELKRVTKPGGKIVLTGLKKAFGLTKFMDLVQCSGLALKAFVDEEAINCYIAIMAA